MEFLGGVPQSVVAPSITDDRCPQRDGMPRVAALRRIELSARLSMEWFRVLRGICAMYIGNDTGGSTASPPMRPTEAIRNRMAPRTDRAAVAWRQGPRFAQGDATSTRGVPAS